MPYVLVLHGLPASGKTTLGRVIAEANALVEVFSADGLRDCLGLPDATLDDVLELYRRLIREGVTQASAGNDIILDATFRRRSYRDILYEGFAGIACELVLVRLVTSVEACRARTEERVRVAEDARRATSHAQSFAGSLAAGDDIFDHEDELSRFSHRVSIDASTRPPSIVEIARPLPPRLHALLVPALSRG